jgi:F-type H+-transporting ATPase subunit a
VTRLQRLVLSLTALTAAILALPSLAFAADEELAVDPVEEFLLDPWGPEVVIGPFDLSFNKAVLYLLIAAVVCVLGTWLIVRGGLKQKPGRTQMFAEIIYSFTETQIARATLPAAQFTRWFPYIATLFVFVWVSNLISYIPLPVDTHNKVGGLPGFSLYAATSSLSVTLALALVTIAASHYVGVKEHGVRKYLKSWVPHTDSKALTAFLIPLEVLSQFLRIISLSVRLFANMLAGHLLVLMSVALIIIIGHPLIGIATVPVGVFFYIFEILLVANLQAFIFAMLSGIYIGFAAEPPH